MKVKKPKTSKTISLIEMEIAISELYGIRQHIIVPNISWGLIGMHEMDLAIVTRAGCLKEVEIKRSFQDLKADFKKRHHHVDRQKRITEFFYAIPIELLEKCLPLIPEAAGIITCHNNANRPYAKFERGAKRIPGSRKLTMEEQLKISRLGCLRIWGLKKKVASLKK